MEDGVEDGMEDGVEDGMEDGVEDGAEHYVDILEVSDASTITESCLLSVLTHCLNNQCRGINLRYAAEFTSRVCAALSKSVCQLNILSLCGAYKLQDKDVGLLIETNKNYLNSLVIEACPKFSSNFCSAAGSLVCLRELDLTNCEKLTTSNLKDLQPVMKNLQVSEPSERALRKTRILAMMKCAKWLQT